MAIEYTLGMIKPDAVSKGHQFHILADLAASGLKPVAFRLTKLTKEMAQVFYAVHRERKFFGQLTEFMSSGPIVAMVLEGEDAVVKYREVMGSTDSTKAARVPCAKFGENIEERRPRQRLAGERPQGDRLLLLDAGAGPPRRAGSVVKAPGRTGDGGAMAFRGQNRDRERSAVDFAGAMVCRPMPELRASAGALHGSMQMKSLSAVVHTTICE